MNVFDPLITDTALTCLQNTVAKETGLNISTSTPSKKKLQSLKLSPAIQKEYIAVHKRLSLLPFHLLENSLELFEFYFSDWQTIKLSFIKSQSETLRSVPLLFDGLLAMTLQGNSCWPEPPWKIAQKIRLLAHEDRKLEKFVKPLVHILIHGDDWNTGTNKLFLKNDIPVIISEHHRGKGETEYLWKSHHKYTLQRETILKNPTFKSDWESIKKDFSLNKYYDRYGIIRRTIMPERNWRKDYNPDYSSLQEQFQCTFDFFCWKWGLYGMKREEPLLEKLSFAITPYGTQIFIPSYWSFDYVRDILWKDLINLHRSRGVGKQGPKLAFNRTEKNKQLKKLYQVCKDADKQKLRGLSKCNFIKSRMVFPPTLDDGQLRKLIREAKSV